MRRRSLIAGAAVLAACSEAKALLSPRKILFTGSRLWTPLNDPNLVAWWDASYLPGLTFNTTNVAAWADRKGGLVASQGSGVAQPAWSATGLLGLPALTFSGSQSLSFNPATLPVGNAASTIYVGARGVGATANSTMICWGPASTIINQDRILGYANSGTLIWYSFNTAPQINAAPSWQNANLFVEGIYDPAAGISLYADGTLIGGPTGAAATNTGSVRGIMGGLTTAGGLTGIIQQIVVTGAVPSTAIRQKYEGWESWYDGKAGSNLPNGHPYKSIPPRT